jgi:hypothetical protein
VPGQITVPVAAESGTVMLAAMQQTPAITAGFSRVRFAANASPHQLVGHENDAVITHRVAGPPARGQPVGRGRGASPRLTRTPGRPLDHPYAN